MTRNILLPADSVLTVSCAHGQTAIVSRVISATLSGATTTVTGGSSSTFGPFPASRLFKVDGPGSASIAQATAESAPVTRVTASGALSVSAAANVITKAGVAALTLAAPAAADDGMVITVTSTTAYAHTITATGLLLDGTTGGAKDVATFAAFAGASITLQAVGSAWHVLSANAVTCGA